MSRVKAFGRLLVMFLVGAWLLFLLGYAIYFGVFVYDWDSQPAPTTSPCENPLPTGNAELDQVNLDLYFDCLDRHKDDDPPSGGFLD